MNRRERLLLLVFFGVVLVLLGRSELTATVLGGVAGAGGGVLMSGRLRRLSERMDDRLGPQDATSMSFSLRRPLLRAGAQLLVLGGLLATTVLVPFVGDELFAASAAAVTAFPAVLTARGLRR